MPVFVCTDHDQHWPVGGASIVVADTESEARKLLDAELVSDGLKPHAQEPYTLVAVDLARHHATILCDGNY